MFLREQPSNKWLAFKKLVSCPIQRVSFSVICSRSSCENGCLLSKLKLLWAKATVQVRRDDRIVESLEKVYDTYKKVVKMRNSSKASEVRKREEFKVGMDCLFDIAVPDAETLIRRDPKRTSDNIEEDLAFLRDQRSSRTMFFW